ncbi:hypothetical protein B0H12DRAFT_1204411 [Mycena haematopus]|nr:hypothetical protein B0H12DRAFT_1204411 [Mycena haematopus]
MSWSTTDETLRDAFSPYGQVTDCVAMKDRETGRMRGFGFVTFSNEAEAQNAINSMNGQELEGRSLRGERKSGGGGGGYGGGGGGYGGGGGGYSTNNSYNSGDGGMQW